MLQNGAYNNIIFIKKIITPNLYEPHLYICLVFLFLNFLVGNENKLYKINLLPDNK